MSQMVLPQNLPNSARPEAAKSSVSSRSGNEKSGESQFDAISRAEQKRLEAKDAKAAKADSEKISDAKSAADQSRADKSGTEKPATEKSDTEKTAPEKTGSEKVVAETPADTKGAEGKLPATELSVEESGNGQKVAADDSEVVAPVGTDLTPLLDADRDLTELIPEEAGIDSIPVTFAGLQSLVAGAQSQEMATATAKGAGNAANSQGLPFIQGSMMPMSGLNGGAGKAGPMGLQVPGQTGSATGIALTETLLAGVTADGSKAVDSPMLQNAIRFQGTLESVNAQANAVNTPKMAPDAPILRGYTTSIDLPVSHAEWGDKMAGKLTWLTARNMSVAEIHLTPPDMGPMEVRVQVQQDQANISVHSANPVVREQLELHSHRLRDMLNEQGISLEQFDVSDSGRDQPGDGQPGTGQQGGQGVIAEAEMEDAGAELQSLDLTWKGEVDIFA